MASADELVWQLVKGNLDAASPLAWIDRDAALTAILAAPEVQMTLGRLLLAEPPVAELAATAMVGFGDFYAVKALQQALHSGGTYQRGYAAAALGCMRGPAALQAATALCDARIACDAGDPQDAQVRMISAALLQLTDAAVEPLCRTLNASSASVRVWAVDLLRRLQDPRAVAPLCARLRDTNVLVRREAAWALRDLGDLKATPALAAALADADASVRWHVEQALRTFGWQPTTARDQVAYLLAREEHRHIRTVGAPALGPLVEFLRHPDAALRLRAAESLGWIGHRGALPALRARLGLLGERDRRVADTIRVAIERIASATDGATGLPRADTPQLDLSGRPRGGSETPSPEQRPRTSAGPEGLP